MFKENNEENLVGPRAGEGEILKSDTMQSEDGQPLWMALLDDIHAITLKPEEVNEAKNKLSKLMGEREADVKACMNMPIIECRKSLLNIEEEVV